MNTTPQVTTGERIKGKLKEGVGKLTGNQEMKEEGKAVKHVEKDTHKVDKQQDKVLQQDAKTHTYAAQAGVVDAHNVGLVDKAGGMVKENVGSLIGNKQMESEGKAVRKTEESAEKLEKETDKLNKNQSKLVSDRLKADI